MEIYSLWLKKPASLTKLRVPFFGGVTHNLPSYFIGPTQFRNILSARKKNRKQRTDYNYLRK